MSNPEIRVVKNKDVDRKRWQECVDRSSTPRIYASPEYLDIVAPEWAGLIYGNYQFVMPLIVHRRLGLSFLLQPIFAQQHGIFPEASINIQTACLEFIQNQFRYIQIQLSPTHLSPFPNGFDCTSRKNLILDLTPEYAEIYSRYSTHTRRQIKKADQMKVTVVKGLQPKEFINLKNQATRSKLTRKSMQTLEQLIEHYQSTGKGTIYAAYGDAEAPCAAAFFLNDGHREIYLNAASSEEGKQNRSMYRIVDIFIRDHCKSRLTLDFEGSSIPGIARFYEGFGATPEYYFLVKMNRLPFPFRWIKN